MIESTPAAARIGEVDAVAPLVAFLCLDDAKWTTGSTLSAKGGWFLSEMNGEKIEAKEKWVLLRHGRRGCVALRPTWCWTHTP